MGDITLREVYNGMQKGFENVYDKIDDVCAKYDTTLSDHETRLATLNTSIQVRKAVNGVKHEVEMEGRDYWKWIIRVVSASCIIVVIAFVFERLVIPALK